MNYADIPMVAPNDSVMASRQEVQQMLDWAAEVFAGAAPQDRFSFLGSRPPLSFIYDGEPSAKLLKTWARTVETRDKENYVEHQVRWTDRETGLQVTAVVTAFKRYPAVDWVIYFENQGTEDTPIIEDIQALDVELGADNPGEPAVLRQIKGDTEDEESFLPFDTDLEPGESIRIAPRGGKSSTDTFPFFNFRHGERGIITAVGWTGQWAASFDRDKAGPVHIRAGMERTHLLLHPGERIRSPRILILAWQGDLIAAHNRFRRLMLFNYVPKLGGRPARLPIALQCFDRYSRTVPEWATEAGQVHAAEVAEKLGCDTLWLDAAWFPDDFPAGVGNWFCKPKEFPNGLRPVSQVCQTLGLQFMLWFEPERATSTSQVAREHPEFLFEKTTVQFGGTSHLFKLNDPEARRWMTDLLSKRITEYGIDIYRNDFNINPLKFWQENDEPDRQGVTEIKYIEGLYEMWDELRARHPGLLIDNVSGGGRRIDLEMCMRSVPMWRSDTGCGKNPTYWNQVQSYGLNLYIPLQSIGVWTPEPYDCRSTATAGAVCQWDYLNKDFPMELAMESIREIETSQKYWYGDFYPLTPCTVAPDQFTAYQFHRSDLNEGIVLAFRRSACETPSLRVNLRGVSPISTYAVEFIDDARQKKTKTMTGKELMSGLELQLDKKESSLLIRYKRIIPRSARHPA